MGSKNDKASQLRAREPDSGTEWGPGLRDTLRIPFNIPTAGKVHTDAKPQE